MTLRQRHLLSLDNRVFSIGMNRKSGKYRMELFPGWKLSAPFDHWTYQKTLKATAALLSTIQPCYCRECRLAITDRVLNGFGLPRLSEWQAGLPQPDEKSV